MGGGAFSRGPKSRIFGIYEQITVNRYQTLNLSLAISQLILDIFD